MADESYATFLVTAYGFAFPHLEHQQKQEVSVGNPLELLKQVKR